MPSVGAILDDRNRETRLFSSDLRWVYQVEMDVYLQNLPINIIVLQRGTNVQGRCV